MIKVTPLQYDQYDHMIYQYVINMIKVPPLQTLTILGSFKTNFKEISRNLFFKTRYWKSSGCILFKFWTTCFFLVFCLYLPLADPALPSRTSGYNRMLAPPDQNILYFVFFIFGVLYFRGRPWLALMNIRRLWKSGATRLKLAENVQNISIPFLSSLFSSLKMI